MARVDYERMAEDYDDARGFDLASLRPWRAAIAPFVKNLRGPVLDLGSGTGQFSGVLAEWLGVDVVAVEPSSEMRTRAEQRGAPRVRVIEGRAEAIPLDNASCGAAWVSTVVHHLDDLDAAVTELRRVLRAGAPVMIRSSFPGRHEHIPLFQFFPEAAAVASTFPRVEELERAFAAEGLVRVHLGPVFGVAAASLDDMRKRISMRADTTLASLSDEAFAAGLARLDEAIAEAGDAPVRFAVDLLVFR